MNAATWNVLLAYGEWSVESGMKGSGTGHGHAQCAGWAVGQWLIRHSSPYNK